MTKTTSLQALATALLASFALSACSSSSGGGGTGQTPTFEKAIPQSLMQIVIDNTVDNVIVAVYSDLNQKTLALHQATELLLQSPTQANLEAAQNAWKAARVPWESSESFLFGPVESLSVDPSIDSWPLSTVDLYKILNENTAITADLVRGLGTDVQGFHTAEFLLFGDGITKNTKSIDELTSAERKYLVACTEVLHEQTTKLLNAWIKNHDPENANSPSYVSIFKHADNQYVGTKLKALGEFIDGMAAIAGEIGATKLQSPFSGHDPSQVESQFSWNSLDDFRDNVRSIQYIYTGDYGDKTGEGLDSLVKEIAPELHEKMMAHLANCIEKIGAIAGPENLSFTVAVRTPSADARIQAAIDALNEFATFLETDMKVLVQ